MPLNPARLARHAFTYENAMSIALAVGEVCRDGEIVRRVNVNCVKNLVLRKADAHAPPSCARSKIPKTSTKLYLYDVLLTKVGTSGRTGGSKAFSTQTKKNRTARSFGRFEPDRIMANFTALRPFGCPNRPHHPTTLPPVGVVMFWS
jgi:hypothetical protein